MAKYNADTDPLQGYDADLAEQLKTDAASRTKILADLGGQTRTTVDFAASRNSSALVAAAGAAVNTSLAEIPRATLPKPTATTPVDSSGNVITRNRMPQLPDVDLQAGNTKALERQVMGLSNHIVSGSAGLPLQTSQPSLRDGLWH